MEKKKKKGCSGGNQLKRRRTSTIKVYFGKLNQNIDHVGQVVGDHHRPPRGRRSTIHLGLGKP